MQKLFKGKRIDNGEWVIGNLVYSEDAEEGWEAIIIPTKNSYIYVKDDETGDLGIEVWYRVDKDTICQYTGLTDKNGNKIWENDILFDEEYFVVRWDEEKAMFVVDVYGTKGCLMEYGFDEDAGGYGVVERNGFDDFCSMSSFEVIGNIFDNPELLGV